MRPVLIAAPPLYALVNLHVLVGGLLFGLLGFGLARMQGGARGLRSMAWIVAGKYASTLLVLLPLTVALSAWLPSRLGSEPLERLPWLLLAYGAFLLVGSALLEWPFFNRALPGRSAGMQLGLALRANAVALLLLVALYLPFCELSLLGAPRLSSERSATGVSVFYLRHGDLFQQDLEGRATRLACGLGLGDDARLFARRGDEGWDLWGQERHQPPRQIRRSVAPESAHAPQQRALHIRLKDRFRTTEPALSETFGAPAGEPGDSPWAVDLGQWPWEGLRVQSRDLRGDYRLALDSPLLAWAPRCGVRLPGERLLFQMGPYLWLLDLETRRLSCWAKGHGAQVIWH